MKGVIKIAYKNLNHYKYTVHRYLDGIWLMSCKRREARSGMYRWLGTQMNIKDNKMVHVKYFNRAQCRQAIQILKPRYIQLMGHDIPYKPRNKK